MLVKKAKLVRCLVTKEKGRCSFSY